MQIRVELHGVELAKARLAEVGRKIDPALRGALNTTGTKARTERYVKPMSGTVKPQRLRRALKLKRARRGRMESRIIPSSSGILVVNYRTWGYEEITPTRARIWVRGPGGRKIAAGFINPSSRHKLPWITRSSRTKGAKTYAYKRALQLAQGPSAAYWFKQLSGADTVKWVNAYLLREFERRISIEITKGVR